MLCAAILRAPAAYAMLPGMEKHDGTHGHACEHRADRAETVRLSFADAAARLGITVAAVRERVRRGTLESVDIDGQRLVVWPPTPRSRRGARSPHDHDARTESTRRATVRADDDAL